MCCLASQRPLWMWRLTTRSEGKTWQPWKCTAQISCFREHNWLRAQVIAILDPQPHSCLMRTSNGLHQSNNFANEFMDAGPSLQTQDFSSGVLWLGLCQPGQTSLQLHCSPKHFIYIVPSFSLSFREVRTALKAFPTVSSSLPFFLHRYFPNKNLTCCARLLFNIQRYQVIIRKICKCTLFGKRIFAVAIS